MGVISCEFSFISKFSTIRYSNLYLLLNGGIYVTRQVTVSEGFVFAHLRIGTGKILVRFFMSE